VTALIAAGWLGCDRDRPEPVPVMGVVQSFSFVDQDGRPVSEADLRGKPWVAAFMFTRCPTVCPRITRRMRDLQRESAERELGLRFVSFSVDPDHDTPEVLRRYAAEHGADLATWSFLTGDAASLRNLGERVFKLAVEGEAAPGAEHFGISHGAHLVLVDPALEIRGYYRSGEDSEMARLLEDAERLPAGG
jgi:protein SCO1/2